MRPSPTSSAELRASVQGRRGEVATLDPPDVLAAVLHHFVLFTAERTLTHLSD